MFKLLMDVYRCGAFQGQCVLSFHDMNLVGLVVLIGVENKHGQWNHFEEVLSVACVEQSEKENVSARVVQIITE
jgi:hypothetical protein